MHFDAYLGCSPLCLRMSILLKATFGNHTKYGRVHHGHTNCYFLAILKPNISLKECLRSPWQLQEQLQQCWRGLQRTWTLSDWSTRWESSLWCHSGRFLQVSHSLAENGLAPGLGQHQAKLRPGWLAPHQRWLRSPAVKTRTSTWLALALWRWQ